MMAVGIARPVKIRVAWINHPLTILRQVLVVALVAIGVGRRRCVRITTVVVFVPVPTPPRLVLVATLIILALVATVMIPMFPMILIIRGGSHWKRQA
jgi:hypothetical protein